MARVTKNKYPRKTGTEKVDIEEMVIQRLISKMESTGQVFWKRGYKGQIESNGVFVIPRNFFTNTPYSGINIFLLMGGSGYYMTDNQIKEYNKKHNTEFWFEAGTPQDTIVFAKQNKKEITEAVANDLIRSGKNRFVTKSGDKYYQVFFGWIYHRVYDCIYIKDKAGKCILPEAVTKVQQPKVPVNEGGTSQAADYKQPYTMVQQYLAATGVKQFVRAGTPHYQEQGDYIATPDFTDYRNAEAYYRDVFHELVHSTGIASRLNRPEFAKYRERTQRSREELVAEVGSMLLTAHAGFAADGEEADNSENYVKSWCSWMKDNPKEMFRGLTETQKAVEYMMTSMQNGAVPQTDASQPETETNVPKTRDELIEYYSTLAENNNERGKRTYTRIYKAGKVQELGAQFNYSARAFRQLPVYSIPLPNKCTIDVGMSFAIYTDTRGNATTLFSLDKEDTLQQAEAYAQKLKHPGFSQLVSYMDLRKSIK